MVPRLVSTYHSTTIIVATCVSLVVIFYITTTLSYLRTGSGSQSWSEFTGLIQNDGNNQDYAGLPFSANRDISHAIKSLYQAMRVPITEGFEDIHGVWHNASTRQPWKTPLGSKLCIVDIDTRRLNGTGQIMEEPLEWNNQHYTTPGILNHYLYALIHGYSYHFIQTTPLEDRASYWTKIPALADTMSKQGCQFTVSIDADATFVNLNLPFEWLMNRWNVTSKTSLTMARDPEFDFNRDSRGDILLNCGFVVAQNLPRTHQILKAWENCPDNEVKYPNCSEWKNPWPAEQKAFGEYIRPEFTKPTDINAIDCSEANGFPEAEQGCDGMFLQHHWSRKDLVQSTTAESAMAMFHRLLHAAFKQQLDEIRI